MLKAVQDGAKQGFVSVISELELLVAPLRVGSWWEAERVRLILEAPGMLVIEMDRRIALSAAQIRASRGLDLTDAAIVATALRAECDVIVGNDRQCAQRVREVPYVLLDELVKER